MRLLSYFFKIKVKSYQFLIILIPRWCIFFFLSIDNVFLIGYVRIHMFYAGLKDVLSDGGISVQTCITSVCRFTFVVCHCMEISRFVTLLAFIGSIPFSFSRSSNWSTAALN